MGNSTTNNTITYNKWLNPDKHFGENFSGPFVHPSVIDFKKEVEDVYQNRTLIENNLEKMLKFKDRDCLGIRKKIGKNQYEDHYTYFKYGEIYNFIVNVAKNIHEQSSQIIVEDTYNDRNFKLVGIFAKNCIEWVLFDHGCQMDSITTVTLYSTLGQEAFKHICEETKISTICVSPDLVNMLTECKSKFNIETLKNVILFDFTTNIENLDEIKKKLEGAGLRVILFTDLLKENTKVQYNELSISKPDTVLTICYTSGTTGLPKGVMIIQRSMISMLEICIRDSGIPLNETSCHISFLPLAHVMERVLMSGFISVAAKIGFISGTVRTTLVEDIGILKPTLLFTVPRVLQTFRAKIYESINNAPAFKRSLFMKALETKRYNFKKYGIITHSLYDKLVFSAITKKFGGKIKAILCSSAPLPKDIADEFKLIFSVPIIEGWGMTELTGPAFATHYTDLSNNSAGGVISTSLLKLVDVPELGYTQHSVINGVVCPSGEICIKGTSTCLGYYKKDEENKKTFDSEGYLHTGDVGCITPYGNGIKIIDRVKEIFKLSQGEYIIPNKLESVYEKSRFVNNILIYGNSMKNNIIGIIVPNKKEIANFLGRERIEDINSVKNNQALINEMRADFDRLAKEANFNSLEKVQYFILSNEEFTIENECMTPTMKMVRKKIEKKFKQEIDDLYKTIVVKK